MLEAMSEVEQLRAQLAEAEAKAKQLEAEAAKAQAEAAAAKLAAAEAASGQSGQEPKPASPPVVDSSEPKAPKAKPADASALADEIRSGYDFDGLVIGSRLEGDVPDPSIQIKIPYGMFNRHMLVAGATGSGKTRTLQLLTEGLSAAGVSVVLCDVKGDLTGVAEEGQPSEKLLARTAANGQEWKGAKFPVELLRLGSADQFPGVHVRTTVTDFGPILLARALDLNTTQEQSLQLVFKWADSNGLSLIDLKDLRSVVQFLTSDEGKEQLKGIGGVSAATAGVILRAVSNLEAQGGDEFFGEPAFETSELLRTVDGEGVISLLGVGDIFSRPALISTVIMWLLADLFGDLPEVGDAEKPKLVFFFDEAHLLFNGASKEFLNQVVQTVRLIRSKGVGVVFVTQTPKDIPTDVLAQLGSKIQHVLRAATPDDQKKLRATVSTFPKTTLDLEEVLTNLGTGEAVVTVLDPSGRPTPVTPTKIWAPASVMAPASESTVEALVAGSALVAKYAETVDPRSAYEILEEQAAAAEAAAQAAEAAKEAAAKQAAQEKEEAARQKQLDKEAAAARKEAERLQKEAARAKSTGGVNDAFTAMLKSASSQLGREISRSLFGTRRR